MLPFVVWMTSLRKCLGVGCIESCSGREGAVVQVNGETYPIRYTPHPSRVVRFLCEREGVLASHQPIIFVVVVAQISQGGEYGMKADYVDMCMKIFHVYI